MTGKERIERVIAGKKVDKLPNLTIVGANPVLLTGVTVENWAKDYRLLAEASILASEKYEIDYYQVQSDTSREATDFGCQIEYYADKLPAIHKAIIHTLEDAAKFKAIKLENAPRMQDAIRAVEVLSKYDDRHLMPLVMGPISVLGSLRNLNDLMMDFYDDPQMVVGMLAAIQETLKDYITAIVNAGSQFIYIADPVASLVSPEFYEQYVLVSQKDLIDHSKKLGAKVRLHICGNTNAILPYSAKSGCNILDVDAPSDYAKACEIAKGHCIINGNINPVTQVFSSTPDQIIKDIKDNYALNHGIPSLIMPGCELPIHTPVENILAINKGINQLELV